jgi:hypothetical protein
MIIPCPIFIHVKEREKTEEERRRERKWEEERRKREEEARYREQKERERIEDEKRRAREAKERALNDAYYKAKTENPWDFKFLPEGWDFLGQRSIYPIDWDGRKGEFEALI